MIAKERDKKEKHPRGKKKKLFIKEIIEIEGLDETAGSKRGVKLFGPEKTHFNSKHRCPSFKSPLALYLKCICFKSSYLKHIVIFRSIFKMFFCMKN